MPVHLEYTVPECDNEDGGSKWKTPALSEKIAMKLLERHEANAHGHWSARWWSYSCSCSQEEFNFFTSEWERYVRSSPGVATTELRDQLFSCPDKNLRTALHRSHGAKSLGPSVSSALWASKRTN